MTWSSPTCDLVVSLHALAAQAMPQVRKFPLRSVNRGH